MRNALRVVLFNMILLLASASHAVSSFEIKLLMSQFSTYVCGVTNEDDFDFTSNADFRFWSPGVSQLTVSSTPVSDSVHYGSSGVLLARAEAQPFHLSAHSDGRALFLHESLPLHHSTAGAKTELWFAPMTSGTAALDFAFFGYYIWHYSIGSIHLLDVTSDQVLWEFGWNNHFDLPDPWKDGRVPWEFNSGPGEARFLANLLLDTDFDADKTYKLTMHMQVFSDWDDGKTSISLSGLTIVPEPSALTLFSCAAGALLAIHRRRILGTKRESVRR